MRRVFLGDVYCSSRADFLRACFQCLLPEFCRHMSRCADVILLDVGVGPRAPFGGTGGPGSGEDSKENRKGSPLGVN